MNNNVGEYCREHEFQQDDDNDLESTAAQLALIEQDPVVEFTYRGESKRNVPIGVSHVTVDPSVKRIENNAFQTCRSLKSIVLSFELEKIGKRAFSECTWLAEIHFFPFSLKTIGSQAFQTCHSLIDIDLPEGLERIEDDAFFGCESLKRIWIPKTVETIGTMAFCGCFLLKHVTLCKGGLKDIGPQAFRSCTNLVAMDLPHGVKVIGKSTFHWCKSLRTVSIPKTMERIEAEAFRNCASLTEVVFPEGLRFIGKYAFQDCKVLSGVRLPSTLEEIDSYAFCNCINLLCVEIPRGMDAEFDNSCFNNCNTLAIMSIREADGPLVVRAGSGVSLLFHKESFVDRFAKLPVHDVCYHSSSTTIDNLTQALDSCNIEQDEYLKDVLGMTPFHIVATSPNRRLDMMNCLLDKYPSEVVLIKDELGMTAMDYLLKQTSSSKVIPLIQAVLQKVLVDPLGALVTKWRLELCRRVEGILHSHDDDNDEDDDDSSTTLHQRMKSVLEYAGHCTRIEMLTIAELSLWKIKMSDTQTLKSEKEVSYRESCQCQSGADVVIDNVIGYLWDDDESTECTALLVHPICSTKSLESDYVV